MKTSNLFNLNFRDVTKGLIVAIGSAVVSVINTTLQAGSLTFDWKQVGTFALAAGISYLAKNFLTPASIVTPADNSAK